MRNLQSTVFQSLQEGIVDHLALIILSYLGLQLPYEVDSFKPESNWEECVLGEESFDVYEEPPAHNFVFASGFFEISLNLLLVLV